MANQLQILWLGLILVCNSQLVHADVEGGTQHAYPITFNDNLSEEDYLGELPSAYGIKAITIISRCAICSDGDRSRDDKCIWCGGYPRALQASAWYVCWC